MKDKNKESELANKKEPVVPIPASGIGTRISEICEGLGTRKYAASIAGVSTDSLQRYIREDVQPPFEVVAKLAIAANKPLDWVATGRLPKNPPPTDTDGLEKVQIQIMNIEVSAGHGSANGHELSLGSLSFQCQYLDSRSLAPEDLRVVYAKGESMDPVIQDGAAMLVNTADTKLDEGCIYVVGLSDHLFAKRVQRALDGSISLISANTVYTPMLVTADQLEDMRVIGRVVWSAHEH